MRWKPGRWLTRCGCVSFGQAVQRRTDSFESFKGRLRDECLNVAWFSSLDDARVKLAKFREHYNRERPHSALADRTPAAFAELHREKASPSLGRALQSLLMEPLECAKPASTVGERTYTAPNL